MEAKITEQELAAKGYEYLGEYGVKSKAHKQNQLWRWRDELIIYDPEDERIIWREWNEPRFQTISNIKTYDLHVGEKEYR